jgi:hypothetical protein
LIAGYFNFGDYRRLRTRDTRREHRGGNHHDQRAIRRQ